MDIVMHPSGRVRGGLREPAWARELMQNDW